MKPDKVIAGIMLVVGLVVLFRTSTGGMGQSYSREVTVSPASAPDVQWSKYEDAFPREQGEPGVSFSWSRTLGLWISALLTLAIFSFLLGDNVVYKLAEAIFLGVSAGYVMVAGFYDGIVGKLLAGLAPTLMRDSLLPGLPPEQQTNWLNIVPLILGMMLLWRLSPKGGWISRWPIALFIGITAGFRMLAYFEADFVGQIQNTIVPLLVFAADGSFDWVQSVKNLLMVTGVLSTLTYFFFSVEHTGVIHRVSRVGIWVLMITFGVGFGMTVMGRIALLAARLEFLFDDWLWLIDPLNRRS
ncbi:MAG: hypothetical protein O2955_12760 [Planctomycetota bacterium]|nr:hypothetical protein [Planctomycetota bacterium]MDA1213379.1 hypothetical protein [Planctomycetota bacterium]